MAGARKAKVNSSGQLPVSLYIHLPWCIRKCPYCDFNSHTTLHKPVPEESYLSALLCDLEYALPAIENRQLVSIFFGGGTPSLFSGRGVRRLLTAIKSHSTWSSGIEITLEANPGTTDSTRFATYREAGVNRLSIGVQSFSDKKLTVLGRIHSGRKATQAMRSALAAGFENINIDLMYALPGQSIAEALDDIKQAIDAGPPHISWYQLTIEPNTAFYSRPPVLPDGDTSWEIQKQGQELLASAGYYPYEISAYTNNKKNQCRHNINYWQFGDYLGLGAGAHSKISTGKGAIRREVRHRIPKAYMDKAGSSAVIVAKRQLHAQDLTFEFMLNALRLGNGFSPSLFEQRTGLAISTIERQLLDAEERGLLLRQKNRIRATKTGSNYLNDLLQIFMPDDERQAHTKLN